MRGSDIYNNRHFLFLFLTGGGQRTARIASSNTVLRPRCVSAEHSRYLTAPRKDNHRALMDTPSGNDTPQDCKSDHSFPALSQHSMAQQPTPKPTLTAWLDWVPKAKRPPSRRNLPLSDGQLQLLVTRTAKQRTRKEGSYRSLSPWLAPAGR